MGFSRRRARRATKGHGEGAGVADGAARAIFQPVRMEIQEETDRDTAQAVCNGASSADTVDLRGPSWPS
jgi:hypothetical protein